MRIGKFSSIMCLLLLAISTLNVLVRLSVSALPSWPTPWIQIDTDPNENGPTDDWRDVQYAYFQFDSNYLYLKLECYDLPGSKWGTGPGEKKARYKWFIDLNGDMYYHGGNCYDAEYLLFVEDYDHNGVGEMYLLYDTDHDGDFSEYEPWDSFANYANYKVTDPNIGGCRIVALYQIEMYIGWASIGDPSSYWLMWATDQQNPNLDQAPTTDRPDEEVRIAIHDVAAISQTPDPTTVTQGGHVTIAVVVENQGTQQENFEVTCYFENLVDGMVGTLPVTNLDAGHSITLYFVWDTTGIPPNTYTIKAWADSGSDITETDEMDNWCTSPAKVIIEAVKVHDVAATQQDPHPTSVEQGDPVDIDVTVENLGDFTETFNVTCCYDGNEIGTQRVTLSPGVLTTLTFTWDTTGVPPNHIYDIKAKADSSNEITESNEGNNECTAAARVTVYKPGYPGELSVDKATPPAWISGPDPPVVGFTTVYELTITVTNTGGSDVTGVWVNDTISSSVTFVSLGTPSQGTAQYVAPKIKWNVGTLSPGVSATLTFQVSVTPLDRGIVTLNYAVDLTASGTDTYTGDPVSDTGDTDVEVTAIVRDVEAISQIPSDTSVIQGDTVTIYVTVRNNGDQVESFDVTCCYDGTLIGTIRVYNLGPAASTILPFAWDTTGVTPKVYDIKAKADSSDEIAESNEGNNICTNLASVKIVIHDVGAISQTPTPVSVKKGGTVTIEVVVDNHGSEPETFDVTCYYDSQIGVPQSVSLLAGHSATLTFYWDTTGMADGDYYIKAVASTVAGEKHTADNTCTSEAIVHIYTPAPGALCVDKAKTAVISGPDPPEVGKTTVYELTITVKNTGGSDVTDIWVQDTISSSVTYVSVETPSHGTVAYVAPNIVWNVGTLGPGVSATLTFRVSLTPTTAGLKYLNHKEDLSASGLTDSTAVSDSGDTDVTVAAISVCPAVGGEWVPINKLQLLSPLVGSATLMAVITTCFVYVKRKKKQQN